MTHNELVEIAHKWLLRRCGFAFKELAAQYSEIPDAIGFRSNYSILIECKTSRSDFFADQKKIFRKNPAKGVGDFRFYMCQKDLIKPGELPNSWGLLYVSKGGRVFQKTGIDLKKIFPFPNPWKFRKNIEAEHFMFYSVLRRLEIKGVMPALYSTFDTTFELKEDSLNET